MTTSLTGTYCQACSDRQPETLKTRAITRLTNQ